MIYMPSRQMEIKYILLHKRDIAYFQFILEGYEGLATATTIDKNKAVVKLFIMPYFLSDVEEILQQLRTEIEFQEIAQPEAIG